MEKILEKLKMLRREQTEYYQKASVAEAVDVLIEAVEFLFNNQPERLNPEDCEHNDTVVMRHLYSTSKRCSKCGSVFTVCDSLNSSES